MLHCAFVGVTSRNQTSNPSDFCATSTNRRHIHLCPNHTHAYIDTNRHTPLWRSLWLTPAHTRHLAHTHTHTRKDDSRCGCDACTHWLVSESSLCCAFPPPLLCFGYRPRLLSLTNQPHCQEEKYKIQRPERSEQFTDNGPSCQSQDSPHTITALGQSTHSLSDYPQPAGFVTHFPFGGNSLHSNADSNENHLFGLTVRFQLG